MVPRPWQGLEGTAFRHGENMRNQSPNEKYESGVQQECQGWSTWNPSFP